MVCRFVGSSYRDKFELCLVMELNDSFNFSAVDAWLIIKQQREQNRNVSEVTECILIAIYCVLIFLGLLSNTVVSFVVARRPQMHTARNLYIVNLTVSDITLCVICMPFTLVHILHRQWTLGVALCKLVPFVQGTNIMVSVGTITVIALDRYFTIVRGQDGPTTRRRVIISIIAVWLLSMLTTMPVLFFQVVESVMFGDLVLYQSCIEQWPDPKLKVMYTVCILMIQAVIPSTVVVCIHARIASYLHAHATMQRDSRRAQRELSRNKRTTILLSGVAVLFTVSWLPIGMLLLVMDLLYPPSLENNVSPENLYLAFAVCHIIAMTSAISNPVVYGWLNSNIRRELIQLLPCKCSGHRRPEGTTAAPSPTMVLCQNGQRPTHQQPATTYTAL